MGNSLNNPVCGLGFGTHCKDSISPMSGSEYSNSNSNSNRDERSHATGKGKTPLRADEVAIVQEKLDLWMAADVTKRKSIFKDIANSIQGLEANKSLKSHHWVMKKKVSASPFILMLPYSVSSIIGHSKLAV